MVFKIDVSKSVKLYLPTKLKRNLESCQIERAKKQKFTTLQQGFDQIKSPLDQLD